MSSTSIHVHDYHAVEDMLDTKALGRAAFSKKKKHSIRPKGSTLQYLDAPSTGLSPLMLFMDLNTRRHLEAVKAHEEALENGDSSFKRKKCIVPAPYHSCSDRIGNAKAHRLARESAPGKVVRRVSLKEMNDAEIRGTRHSHRNC